MSDRLKSALVILNGKQRTGEEIIAYYHGKSCGENDWAHFTGFKQNIQEAFDDGYQKGYEHRERYFDGTEKRSLIDYEIMDWAERQYLSLTKV